MAKKRCRVTPRKRKTNELPQRYNEAVALVTEVDCLVGLPKLARMLRLQRGNGYQGVDLLMPLVGMFTGGECGGLKGWLANAAGHSQQLAAVAGRCSLPTQGSVSRTLQCVDEEHAQRFGAWLLRDVTQWKSLLSSPTVQHRDALGKHWHMFDYDPSVVASRQRKLPEGEDLGEAPPQIARHGEPVAQAVTQSTEPQQGASPAHMPGNEGIQQPESTDNTTVLPAETRSKGRYNAITPKRRAALLAGVDWKALVRQLKSDWRVGEDGRSLICPQGQPLTVKALSPYRYGAVYMRLRAPPGCCGACVLRSACTQSKHDKFRKEICVHIPDSEVGKVVSEDSRPTPPTQRLKPKPVNSTPATERTRPRPSRSKWLPPALLEHGPWQAQPAALLPAVLSHRWLQAISDARISVKVSLPATRQQPHRSWLSHEACGGRQQRRRTWEQRHSERSLPDSASTSISIQAPGLPSDLFRQNMAAMT